MEVRAAVGHKLPLATDRFVGCRIRPGPRQQALCLDGCGDRTTVDVVRLDDLGVSLGSPSLRGIERGRTRHAVEDFYRAAKQVLSARAADMGEVPHRSVANRIDNPRHVIARAGACLVEGSQWARFSRNWRISARWRTRWLDDGDLRSWLLNGRLLNRRRGSLLRDALLTSQPVGWNLSGDRQNLRTGCRIEPWNVEGPVVLSVLHVPEERFSCQRGDERSPVGLDVSHRGTNR